MSWAILTWPLLLDGSNLGVHKVPRRGSLCRSLAFSWQQARSQSRLRMCLLSGLWACLNVRVEPVDVSLHVLALLLDWKETYRMISDVFCWLPHFRVYMNVFFSDGIHKVVTKTMLSTLTGLMFFVIQHRDKCLKQAGVFLTQEAWGTLPRCVPCLYPSPLTTPKETDGVPWLWECHHDTCTLNALLPARIAFSSLGCLIFSCQHFRGAQIGYVLYETP